MPAPASRSSTTLSGLTAVLAEPAPHLILFTLVLLLLLYGYEIFNFSLSIDEELFEYFGAEWWLGVIAQGRWGTGLLARLFPRMGNIPMISTLLFCAGLGFSAYVLARVLFRSHSAQFAFAGIFVSSPLWPHLAQFNISSWCVGIGCVLVTFALIFFLADRRWADILVAGLLAIATGIGETLYLWFLVLLCIRHLAVLLGTGPPAVAEGQQRFPWLRIGVVAVAGLLIYFVVQRLLLLVLAQQLKYVQRFMRVGDLIRHPEYYIPVLLRRIWNLLSGADPLYLGYGYVLILLPVLGLLILLVRLLWRGPLRPSQRLVAGALLPGALIVALSPLILSAGTIPSRSLIAWIPINAFLAGVAFAKGGRFVKPLYAALAAALFISIWINVSLFYTDHLARQRDQLLAARIMTRVDRILPEPLPGRIPFVLVGATPATGGGSFRKLEVFGDSFFDTSHEGGNPKRVAAYLRILGVDTFEPHRLEDASVDRPTIEAMPMWPAAGSVAMVNGILVIKLGPM